MIQVTKERAKAVRLLPILMALVAALACYMIGIKVPTGLVSHWLIAAGSAFLILSILAFILCFLSMGFPMSKRGYVGRYGKFTKLGLISILFRGMMAFIVGFTFFGSLNLHQAIT